jgi:endonuclease YncB( thermonuclease family)
VSAALLCLVVAIADGDTLTARCGEPGEYMQVKVRISAIDSPEKAQPFGQRSRQSLAELCHQQPARITERARDRYGRSVADVECQGRDVGQHQVATGMAWVYDRYAKGYAHLYPLQGTARAERRGLWADPAPVPPWEWRRK